MDAELARRSSFIVTIAVPSPLTCCRHGAVIALLLSPPPPPSPLDPPTPIPVDRRNAKILAAAGPADALPVATPGSSAPTAMSVDPPAAPGGAVGGGSKPRRSADPAMVTQVGAVGIIVVVGVVAKDCLDILGGTSAMSVVSCLWRKSYLLRKLLTE